MIRRRSPGTRPSLVIFTSISAGWTTPTASIDGRPSRSRDIHTPWRGASGSSRRLDATARRWLWHGRCSNRPAARRSRPRSATCMPCWVTRRPRGGTTTRLSGSSGTAGNGRSLSQRRWRDCLLTGIAEAATRWRWRSRRPRIGTTFSARMHWRGRIFGRVESRRRPLHRHARCGPAPGIAGSCITPLRSGTRWATPPARGEVLDQALDGHPTFDLVNAPAARALRKALESADQAN